MGRWRPPTVALLAAAVLGVGAPRAARADQDAQDPGLPTASPVEDLLGLLGKPARPAIVRRTLACSEVRTTDAALMVVRAFTAAGGAAATEGLLTLAGHRDPIVRAWALRGVRDLGLRTSRGVEEARRALQTPDGRVRRHACWALGVLGDARDVPVLLAIAQDEGDPVAGEALSAVQRLGGLKGPNWKSVGRVKSWWEANRERYVRETEEALTSIEAGTEPGALSMSHAILRRAGWVDPGTVVERVRGWLGDSDARLRLEGYRVVEGLRLGDLADATGAALQYETDEGCLRAGGAAVRAVGVPLPAAVEARIRRADAGVVPAPPPTEAGEDAAVPSESARAPAPPGTPAAAPGADPR